MLCFYQLGQFYLNKNELINIKKQNEIIQNNLEMNHSDEKNYIQSILVQQENLMKQIKHGNIDVSLVNILQDKIDGQLFTFCHNDIINAVLSSKSSQMTAYHIQFDYQIELSQSICMKDIHLSALLFNLIDNAIEAVIDLPEEKRLIQLHISTQYQTFILVLSNYFVPGKTKDYGHGYGLMIVDQILDTYQGERTINVQDDLYQTYINILGGKDCD